MDAPARLLVSSSPHWSPDQTGLPGNPGRFRIVVVDDDPDIADLLAHMLRKIGATGVHCFGAAAPAFEWCRKNTPDLVFLDYHLPQHDGLAFLQEFTLLPGTEDVPVVMLTVSEDRDSRHRALRAGAADFLTKPIDEAELVARSSNLIALRNRTQKLHRRAGWLEQETRRAAEDLMRRDEEMLTSIGRAAEFRDPEIGAHLQRMSQYSRIIARELGLSRERQDVILRAAPLHDVGNLGTPDCILLKPGRLTAEEFEIMKRHAQHGHEILRLGGSPVIQLGATIAHTHHEKWDGTGYPRGLRGSDIPLEGRIVAVADVFDALTSARPYKSAWEIDRAAQFLHEQSGRHFDPICLEAFFAAWHDVLRVRRQNPDNESPVDRPAPAPPPVRYAA